MGILKDMRKTAEGIDDLITSSICSTHDGYAEDVYASGVRKITRRGCIGCLILPLILIGSCIGVFSYCSNQKRNYREHITDRQDGGSGENENRKSKSLPALREREF